MVRNIKKISILLIIALLAVSSFGCKKKHKWIELDANGNPVPTGEKIAPGVHPERGSDSNAIPVISALIYYPTGMVYDKKSKSVKQEYKKYMYDLEEMTPEAIDEAMKAINLISEDSLFVDFKTVDSNEVVSAGPGSSESMLTKKGIVRYAELSTDADNSDKYEDKFYPKDLVGMISMDDIAECIRRTYEENFQLVSCDIEVVDYDEYLKVHKK